MEMDGLNTFLISTGALTLFSLTINWYTKYKNKLEEKKLREKVLSSPETSWKKVAKVKELFCYPLKSGKAKSIKECYFGEYGVTIDEGVRPIEDRMFIAFEEDTKKFITGRSHPKLLKVKFSFVTKKRAKFEVDDMPPVEFDVPDHKSEPTPITMWFGENINGIDCGLEPSKWLSKYLNGKDSGVRLAICIPDQHRNVTKGPAESYTKAFSRLRNEDTGMFSDLASYMILSEESVNDLNKRLEKPIPPLQLRPNILVEGCRPYDEDNWEWIKIGDNAVIRSFKLCTRCTMTRIDPDTGIPDPKHEPLKTLRSYRKLKDSVLDQLEGHAPALGVYCGLYRAGTVRINDDVYVYQDDDKSAGRS